MQKTSLISLPISTGTYQEFCKKIVRLALQARGEYVCVANVHMLVEAYKDKKFAEIVNNAAIVTPDGLPLTWALKGLHGIKQERVAGMDLLPDLLERAAQEEMPVFFYGGTEEMLEKTKTYVAERYAGIPAVYTYSPPFRPLTNEENSGVVERINASGAKLIFVVLGCPKQEKWMASMQGRINGAMVGIGGALPVLIGTQKRAPRWMQRSGLEWLYRLCQEPRRLFKRYFVTNSLFLWLVAKEKWKQR